MLVANTSLSLAEQNELFYFPILDGYLACLHSQYSCQSFPTTFEPVRGWSRRKQRPMAPVAATIASHLEGISGSARAREVYKYVMRQLGYTSNPERVYHSSLSVLTNLLAGTFSPPLRTQIVLLQPLRLLLLTKTLLKMDARSRSDRVSPRPRSRHQIQP